MGEFGYARPGTIAEAVSLLSSPEGDVVALAGGTDLIVGLRHGTVTPRVVVDLKGVADLPRGIEETGGTVRIGGGAVMTDIVDNPSVAGRFPALAEAAVEVGSIQIRNRATLAGNLCNASPAADTAPPLLVYGAIVNCMGPSGERAVPVDDFFVGPGRNALIPGELVTSIDLPVPGGPCGAAFSRMTRRRGVDLASVSVASLVSAEGTTSLGLGAVGPRPLLVRDDSGALADPSTPDETRDDILASLLAAASPITDVRAGEDYRRAMLAVLARRTTRTATERKERR